VGQAFSTDYSVMQQAEAMFQAKNREMVELLDNLEADLQSGLSKWEDDARDAFFDARAKWDKAAREQARMIKEFHQVVMTARGNYQTAEKANSELWA